MTDFPQNVLHSHSRTTVAQARTQSLEPKCPMSTTDFPQNIISHILAVWLAPSPHVEPPRMIKSLCFVTHLSCKSKPQSHTGLHRSLPNRQALSPSQIWPALPRRSFVDTPAAPRFPVFMTAMKQYRPSLAAVLRCSEVKHVVQGGVQRQSPKAGRVVQGGDEAAAQK